MLESVDCIVDVMKRAWFNATKKNIPDEIWSQVNEQVQRGQDAAVYAVRAKTRNQLAEKIYGT